MNTEWSQKRLGDIAQWGSGGTPKADKEEFYGGNIPWLVIGDLNDGIVSESAHSITELGLKNSSAKVVKPGTVLIAMYGSIGKLGLCNISCATNQAIAFAETNDQMVSNKYLFYYLLSIRSTLISLGKGGTQQNISQTVLKQVSIPVPPRREQDEITERIEARFSELDNVTSLLKVQRTNIEIYRTSLLRALFPLDNAGLITSPLTGLGKWLGGGTPSKSNLEYWHGGSIPWVSPKDMKSSTITKTEDHITETAIKESSTKRVPAHATLFVVRSGILRRTLPIAYADIEVALNQDMQAFVPGQSLEPTFVYWFCEAHKKDILNACAKDGTTVESLDTMRLRQYPIAYPESRVEQKRIALKIEAAASEINQQEKAISESLIATHLLRQSVLKKAFHDQLI